MNTKPIRHFGAIVAWGLASIIVWFVVTQIGWIFVIGRNRIHPPEIVWHIIDIISRTITLPAIWVRPQSVFDNMVTLLLITGIFWGVLLHVLSTLIKMRKRAQPET